MNDIATAPQDSTPPIIEHEHGDGPFFLSIEWSDGGYRDERRWEDHGGTPVLSVYRFQTKAELDGFLFGVEEANGYMGFFVHDGSPTIDVLMVRAEQEREEDED